MTALILLAHGSRHPDTGIVLDDGVKRVGAALPGPGYGGPSQVRLAWLDLDEPLLADVCAELAASGEHHAVAVPLLFTEAFHARVDVPEQVAQCQRHGVEISVAPGLGLGEGTRRAVLQRIVETACAAEVSGPVDALIMAVGSSDAAANEAVHHFATSLDGNLPGRVSAAFVVGPEDIKGAAAVEAARVRAAMRGRALVVVPLFTAPGLLWDKVIDEAAPAAPGEVLYATPLAELLVPIVGCRWDSRDAASSLGVSPAAARSRELPEQKTVA